MVRLFVYGSLLSGQDNAHLMSGAQFVGAGCTSAAFRLVHLGGYPGMLANGACSVTGEIYEVSEAHLDRLDAFEEHPDVFLRARVQVIDGKGHQVGPCEAYLLRPECAIGAPEFPGNDWRVRSRG